MASQIAIGFEGENVAAQEAVDAYVRRYVWRVSRETRAAISVIVERAIREGIAPYDAARMVRAVVGLNEQQAAAVANYNARLRESSLAASPVVVSTRKYADKLLRARSRTIARTEIMGALNAGSQARWEQARNDGLLENPVKEWMITPDELLCPICEPLAGEKVPLDASFSIGVDQPPAHPNCRCSTSVTEAE
jgi:hypothetical protein